MTLKKSVYIFNCIEIILVFILIAVCNEIYYARFPQYNLENFGSVRPYGFPLFWARITLFSYASILGGIIAVIYSAIKAFIEKGWDNESFFSAFTFSLWVAAILIESRATLPPIRGTTISPISVTYPLVIGALSMLGLKIWFILKVSDKFDNSSTK